MKYLIVVTSVILLYSCAGAYKTQGYDNSQPSFAERETKNPPTPTVPEDSVEKNDYNFRYATPDEIKSAPKKHICGIRNIGPKKIGNPYMVAGVMYYPLSSAKGYSEEGVASWYGPGFHGGPTANGEVYDQHAMTAAHRTLPLPSIVSVKNLENGKEVIVRVNDRGPFAKGRIIDLSEAAANKLDMEDKGTAMVRVTVLSEEAGCYVAGGKEVNLDKGDFAVQLAAFMDPKNAESLVERLGERASVMSSNIDGDNWNRVIISGYKTREDADRAVWNFASEFPGAFVVRYK